MVPACGFESHRFRLCLRGAAWSAGLVVSEEVAGSNPAGGAELEGKGRHGTQTGKAARLKPGDSVGSTPTRATRGWPSRVVLLTAACKTVAIEL